MSLWGRYFLKETFKVFFLFIICFYGLYVLVDFSSHTTSFYHHVEFHWKEVIIYYFCDFLKRAEVIIPFALMIATIKTLCSLNIHHELVALMASGVELKTLLKPFIFLGLLFTLLIYVNTEIFLPVALKNLSMIDTARSIQKNKTHHLPSVQHVVLENDSFVIFQDYDPNKECLIDVYWVRSIDDIVRITYLYPFKEIPEGISVDYLQRNEEGKLVLRESLNKQTFSDLHFNSRTLTETLTQPQDLSLSKLQEKLPAIAKELSEKEAQTLSVFYYKMVIPWLCLLAIIGPAPFCIRFTRQLPVFFIYAFSVFGLVAFYLAMDASLILGSRQVLHPTIAIFSPFFLCFGVFFMRYIKITS